MSVAVKHAPELIAEVISQPQLPMYRFTVAQYHRLVEVGILTDNDRVELLEGWIINKMPRKPPHDGTLTRMNRRLLRLLPDEWLLRVQSAVTLQTSEPEPDFAIVHGPEEVYFTRHPRPRDVGLIIDVADSTLLDDRRYKGQIYAPARIPAYWIINLVDAKVEVYTEPRGGKSPAYRRRHDYGPEEAVLLILRGSEIARLRVSELLPR